MMKMNLPPESVVYTGKYNNTTTIIEVYSYDQETVKFNTFKDEDFESELKAMMDTERILWINVIGLNVVETLEKLGEMFGLSSFVLEDIVQVSMRSKIEFTDNYLFSIFKMIYRANGTEDIRDNDAGDVLHEHLSIILLENTVVTFQENEGDVFDDVRRNIENNGGRIRNLGADYLYYALLDALVDNQLEILATISDEIDEHEQVTVESSKISLEQLFKLRKQLLLIQAAVIPFKDILVDLQSKKTEWISDEVKVYLSDVNDHVNHVNDLVSLYRERVKNIYEINMLNSSDRLNRIMTILTVFSAIFIPLNFMTGFYGMNFTHFPGMNEPNAIPIFLAVCLLVVASMVVFMKKRKWF